VDGEIRAQIRALAMPQRYGRVRGAIVRVVGREQGQAERDEYRATGSEPAQRGRVRTPALVVCVDSQRPERQQQICGIVPRIGPPEEPDHKRKKGQAHSYGRWEQGAPAVGLGVRRRGLRAYDEPGGRRQRQERQRQGDDVRVQVCVQEREEGKLIDLTVRHHPGRVPVPPFRAKRHLRAIEQRSEATEHLRNGANHRERPAGCPCPQGAQSAEEQARLTEIAQHRHERRAQQAKAQRARQPASLVHASRDQIDHHAAGAHRRHGKKSRDGQIVGHRRHDAGGLDQRGHQRVPQVVVVHGTAGEPGIVRREPSALQNGIQIGQIHGLLPAHDGVPEIRVAVSDQSKGSKKDQERDFFGDYEPPPLLQELGQRAALNPGGRHPE